MNTQTFYFSDGPYLQSMQGLYSALAGSEAFIKFIGQPRTGKSGVCEKLTQYMRLKDYRVIYFDYAVESPDMLRSMLAKELDVPDSFNMLRQLEDALASELEKPLIFIFDDAHQLSDITLIEIYRLAGVQVDRKRVINIVLCGEPELERRLNKKKQFTALLQHVSHNFLLEPMDAVMTTRFVQAYLAAMGLPVLQFEAAANSQFYKSSKGFPGPAYSLAQLVYSMRQHCDEQPPLTKEELQRAIRNADSEQPVSSGHYRVGNRSMVFAPVAVVVVIASLALLLRLLSPAEVPTQDEPGGIPAAIEESSLTANDDSPFALDELDTSAASTVATREAGDEVDAERLTASGPADTVTADAAERDEVPALQPPVEVLSASDSSLALVTAQERGITEDAIVEPEFEPLVGEAPAVTAAEPAVVPSSGVRVESELPEVARITLTRPMLALDDEETEEPLAPEAVDAVADMAAPVRDDSASSASAELAAGSPQATVQSWLDAWQGQDLERYFASYAEDFIPRYHRSRAAWHSNRERVIGNASQIQLALSDFEIVAEDAETVEVHFWLAYRSPSYRDDTRKKLILKKLPFEEGVSPRLVILEEINLEVRV